MEKVFHSSFQFGNHGNESISGVTNLGLLRLGLRRALSGIFQLGFFGSAAQLCQRGFVPQSPSELGCRDVDGALVPSFGVNASG